MRTKPTGHETRSLRLVKNHCFVCGGANPEGMHLNFFYDETRGCFVCRFRLSKRFTGPPGHCHGGIIATILDEAMGKVNRLRDVVALTAQITVNYLKPVPLHQPLRVESREVRVRGRRHFNAAEILNEPATCWPEAGEHSSPSIPSGCSPNIWTNRQRDE